MEPTNQGVQTPARDYKSTMNLPTTEFPMRANSAQREPEFQARWDAQKIYQRSLERRSGAPSFVLHDGPPYLSSPNIHIGHALNRTLKDILVKFHALNGRYAPFVPGYDCHGLPIENAVLKTVQGGRHSMTALELREKCQAFAEANLEGQQAKFRRLGILADWENPYLTMNPAYEAKQIEVFGQMAQKGYIYRGLKPVYWCPTCETALAEAEVEYDTHVSPSIYVKFPLKVTSQSMVAKLAKFNEPVHLVIWTTTPWTLPANVAISVNPTFRYVILKTEEHGLLMVAKDLAERFMAETGVVGKAVEEFSGVELEMLQAQHPFLPFRTSLVITGEHVTAEAGTGLVHTAPGHGLEDYEVAKKYKLPVLAPVNAQGVFTEEAGALVAGQRYNQANPVIVKRLADTGYLIQEKALEHSYPHCWRCHKPVIYRATEQWFASVDGFRQAALEAIKGVQWVPETGEKRISNMVESRGDWCISRQRSWGVPIPIFYCEKNNHPLVTSESIEAVRSLVEKEGTNGWWRHDAAAILPAGTACAECGETHFRKEMDIMDVWFDSGTSHVGVLEARGLGWPADVYLEGTDQYRGWFQSSLLTAVSTRDAAPYRTVITHGFTVDENGRKMSKSIGNTVEPAKVMEQYGADILRLWVSSVDYQADMRVSDNILKQLSDIYRKIRNTARYVLSNLYDFDVTANALPYAELEEIDRYALHRLSEVVAEVTDAIEKFEFYRFYQVLQNYCVVDLSSFYFDILKDTLYADGADSKSRRSAQTVLHEVLMTLTTMIAPVLSHLAEDIWQFLPTSSRRGVESVFLTDWPKAKSEWLSPELKTRWEGIAAWREVALKALEQARQDKRIGSALQARVVLFPGTPELANELQALGEKAIAQILIASQVRVADASEARPENVLVGGDLAVAVEIAEGEKCQRCWTYSTHVGESTEHPTLCDRCVTVVA